MIDFPLLNSELIILNLTIVILAGGRSRRMGRDKASLMIDGETFLERTARIAFETGQRSMIVGRSRPAVWLRLNVRFIADDKPGLGPLGGLATALRQTRSSVLLLSCDMPQLTTEAVAWLVGIARRKTGANGLIVCNGDRIEPLFSVYFPSALPLAEDCIDRKMLAMQDFIGAGEFEFVSIPEEHSAALRNVNRPEEWPPS